jgi:hypothetical protein
MNKKLFSLPALAGLIVAAGALSAQAAPVGGIALKTDVGTVQKVHYDGDRRWDNDRPWWRKHRQYDNNSYKSAKWWWWRHRNERFGDRSHDHDRRDHRWR